MSKRSSACDSDTELHPPHPPWGSKDCKSRANRCDGITPDVRCDASEDVEPKSRMGTSPNFNANANNFVNTFASARNRDDVNVSVQRSSANPKNLMQAPVSYCTQVPRSLMPTAPLHTSTAGFRLRPRGGASITPNPKSRVSSRGRKRDAHCLASAEIARAGPSPQVQDDRFDTVEICTNLGLDLNNEAAFSSIIPPSPFKCPPTPNHFEFAMQGLSIKSPRPTTPGSAFRSPAIPPTTPSSSTPTRSIGSSFTAYKGSSADVNKSMARYETASAAGMSGPSPGSLPKSSPRIAPLKVVHNGDRSCHQESDLSRFRPPLHGRLTPKIRSLGNSDENAELPNSWQPARSARCLSVESPSVLGAIPPSPFPLISLDGPVSTPRNSNRFIAGSPLSGVPAEDFQSPHLNSLSSPVMAPQSMESLSQTRTPRTPLPRAKLTPRSTHTIQFVAAQSTSPSLLSTHKRGVNMGRSSHQIIPQQTPRRSLCLRNSPPHRSLGKDSENHNIPHFLDSSRSPRGIGSCTSPPATLQRSEFILPPSLKDPCVPLQETPRQDGVTCADLVGEFLGVKAKSLLTPSRSGGMLEAMVREEAATSAMDADGSLSDSDDEFAFILASPSAIAQERSSQNQSRQRRRRSYVDTASSTFFPSATHDSHSGRNFAESPGLDDLMNGNDGGTTKISVGLGASYNDERQLCDNQLSIGNRDICTPPAVPMVSNSPPPLSSRSNASTIALAVPSNVTMGSPVRRPF